jgi:hypothetical protein
MPQLYGVGQAPSQVGQVFKGLLGWGVWGDVDAGQAVVGTCDGEGTGVYGLGGGEDAMGVFGMCSSNVNPGIWGNGPVMGVFGTAGAFQTGPANGVGVVGKGDNAGVMALNYHNDNAAYLASDCCAAWFTGQVHVHGHFSVTGGKSAVVQHPDGTHRRLYCMESPESWFEDFGHAELRDGHADIRIDPEFAALVHRDDYHVFLTPYGDSNGLYVAERRPDGFRVREHQGGKHSLEFAYRVVAKRRDVTVVRLERAHLPSHPSKPPEPRVPGPPLGNAVGRR